MMYSNNDPEFVPLIGPVKGLRYICRDPLLYYSKGTIYVRCKRLWSKKSEPTNFCSDKITGWNQTRQITDHSIIC